MTKDLERATKTVGQLELLILVIKVKGGWKFRTRINLSDLELGELLPKVEQDLVQMIQRLSVAETMLKELPPSGHHPRWDEFAQRVEEVVKAMNGAAHVER